MRRRGLFLVLVMACLAAPAYAQSEHEISAARSTAGAGIDAFHEGHFEEAAELLARAESVVHAPTHLLFLARAKVKLGRFVEAREIYIKLTREQLSEGAPDAFREAQDSGRTELAELEPRIASLKVVVTGVDRSEVRVEINGTELPNIAIGVATPADPGKSVVVVSGPGGHESRHEVTLAEGASEEVLVAIEPPPPLVPALPKEAPASAEEPESPPPVDSGSSSEPSSSKRMWGYGLGAVGLVGLGVGGTFGVLTLSDASKAERDSSLCPARSCSDDGDDFVQDARTKAMVSNIGLGVGAVLVGIGAYLIVTSPTPERSGLAVQPLIGAGSGGLMVQGGFQ